MPVVEISMYRGRTDEELRAIASAIHDAMVETYDVPAADRFQVVKQYEPNEFIFDTLFMGGPRTDKFLMIQITAGRPRAVEVKNLLFRAVVENLRARVGLDPEDVLILLGNVELSDLSLGGGRPFDR